MALSKQSVRDDLTAAMKRRDADLTGTLRMLLAAIGNAEVAGKEQIVLSSDQVVSVVRAETKKRVDAAAMYSDAGRPELAEKELAEAAILSRYLPAELSDARLAEVITRAVAQATTTGQQGPKAMGTVMKFVKQELGSSVDGTRMAAAVKAALAS